jgi:hypothetical protein
MGRRLAVLTGMTAVKTASARVPLEDMKGIIARALAQGDYEHDCERVRPPSCSCHRGEQSCLLPASASSCQGYPVQVPTPEEHLVNLAILTAGLSPDTDGTVDPHEAVSSIGHVIEQRLSGDYILRLHSLVRGLTEQAELYEQENGLTGTGIPGPDDPAPGYTPRCQHCGNPIPAARGPKARYCKNGCRVMASRARKRERERG